MVFFSLANPSIHLWFYGPLLGPGLFFSFVIFFTQSVGLLGRVISPSQGRYLLTGQHKRRINPHTDIHALSWIWTHDPSVWASEDSSCLSPPGHREKPALHIADLNLRTAVTTLFCTASRRLRAHLASYPMGTGSDFCSGKAAEAWSWSFTSVCCQGEELWSCTSTPAYVI
jgi:hypothetical protein